MDVNVNRNMIEDIPQEEYSIGFEIEKTPVRLGKSDKYIYIDFNDTNLPVRLQEARENISKYFEDKKTELNIDENLSADNYSIEEIDQILKVKKEFEKYIRSQLDYIFGYKICDDVFGISSVISVNKKGEYYFDNFLNSILPLIEKEFDIRLKATSEKVKYYLDRKGTHPALKK